MDKSPTVMRHSIVQAFSLLPSSERSLNWLLSQRGAVPIWARFVLSSLFQATRQEADLSLQAAEAYQKIVDALSSARQAAEDASAAAQRAYEQVRHDQRLRITLCSQMALSQLNRIWIEFILFGKRRAITEPVCNTRRKWIYSILGFLSSYL